MQPTFNPRRLILYALAVLLLILVAFGALWRRPAELTWKGKPAFYWLARLIEFDSRNKRPAEEFVFAAGPAIVPELVRGLSLPDHWLYDRWVDVYFKLGSRQRFFRMPIKRAAYRANCAHGLGLLGSAGAPAVPALLNALDDRDPWVRSAAARSLGRIGADKARVIPRLVAGLASTDSNHRLACGIGLGHLLPSPGAAAALRKLISNPDASLRTWAAWSLWRDESDPEATFAALVTALKDGDARVRRGAAESLGRLRYKHEASAKALLAALEAEIPASVDESNELVVGKVVTALGELGVAAGRTVPLLTQLAARTNTTGTLSVVALARIEPQEATWTDELIKRLEGNDPVWAAWELGRHGERARSAVGRLRQIAETSRDWDLKVMAATAAWRLDPSSPNPLKQIADELPQQQGGHYEVIRLLGELGPAARIAAPVLCQLQCTYDIVAREYANEALLKIAPEYVSDPWRK